MFTESSRFYDQIYSFKDYETEANQIHAMLLDRHVADGAALLDVACGTGVHDSFLKQWYSVSGLDLNETFLAMARQRNPALTFYPGNMMAFDLEQRYGAVVCLFSAIGSAQSVDELRAAIGAMAKHLKPGGVLIVEPWLFPEDYRPGSIHATFVDEPALKIARMTVSQREGRFSVFDFHYTVGTPDGISTFVEHHKYMLFTHEEYTSAFTTAGLTVEFDAQGLTGRGLYIATLNAV